MSESLGTAVLELTADDTKLGRTLDSVERSTTQRMGALGSSLTKTLTPAAGAIGLVGKQAFDQWDGGLDTIRAKTGATGKELDALGDVMKTVGGQVNQPLATVGETVAELNARLGVTGKPLETLTRKFVNLKHLGIDASVENVTRLFGDWDVATGKQAETMDRLFRASQATGPSVDRLSGLLVRYGAPLRQLGFGFEQSAVLMGKFEKEGVNTELVLGSMRIALGKMSKASGQVGALQAKVTELQVKHNKAVEKFGPDSNQALIAKNKLMSAEKALSFAMKSQNIPEMFAEQVAAIKKAGSTAEANAIALELFGARAGPDMAAAIREGRFDIEALFKQVAEGTDTIDKAAEETFDLGDKFKMLRNRVFATIGPYGEFIAAAAGGLATIGPALLGVSMMSPALGKMASALKLGAAAQWLMNAAVLGFPLVWVAGALVAVGVGLVVLWKKSSTFREIVTGAFGAVKAAIDAVGSAFGWIRDHGGQILDVLAKHPSWLLLRAAVGKVDDALAAVRAGIRWLGGQAGDLLKKADWGAVVDVVKKPFELFAAVIGKIVDGVRWLIDNIKKIPRLPFSGEREHDPFRRGDAHDPRFGTGFDLMGAAPVMAPFAAAAAAHGLRVTSGLRPGAITANGTPSDHGIGKALDVAGPAARMGAYFKTLIGNRAVKQAFYDPLGSIFSGAWSSYREGGHSDHVHVATFDRGGWLPPGLTLAANLTGRPERILDPDQSSMLAGGRSPMIGEVHLHDGVDIELLLARVERRLAKR